MSPNGWLLDHDMTGADLAVKLSVSETIISRVLTGTRYPSFPIMWGMYRLSNGAVSLPDWIAVAEARAKSGAALPPSRSPNPKLVRGKRR